jgi:antitoxin (DNA-binding transcriptional repressor) of toxin-antitoxin stability system
MRTVDLREAKATLSRLAAEIESGHESEIVITRDGKPAARIVALREAQAGSRLGVARGQFVVPDSIDDDNAAIAALFGADDEQIKPD